MATIAHYGSIPFFYSPDGRLVAGHVDDAPNGRIAQARAEGLIGRKAVVISPHKSQPSTVAVLVGAVAFSRAMDGAQDIGKMTVLARYGETPDSLKGIVKW